MCASARAIPLAPPKEMKGICDAMWTEVVIEILFRAKSRALHRTLASGSSFFYSIQVLPLLVEEETDAMASKKEGFDIPVGESEK